jgi:hypothetical protein
LELHEKFRHINIPASTPGTYSTQNMFPLIYHTQLLCDTTCTQQVLLSAVYLVLNTATVLCQLNAAGKRPHWTVVALDTNNYAVALSEDQWFADSGSQPLLKWAVETSVTKLCIQ